MTVRQLHHADFLHGRWEDVLRGVSCDAIIADPPYSARTHDGHNSFQEIGGGARNNDYPESWKERRTLCYDHWTSADVDAFVDAWAPRNRGWFVCLSDNELCGAYRAAFERNGLTGFAPVGILIPGMTVRMAGDGPSSWMIYANVARPKALHKWGTLPGGYTGPPGERVHVGGKPLWAMRALVRDYSKPGDVICDPVCGAASTLIAAMQENRLAIGAEADLETWKVGMARIKAGYTPTFDFGGNP